MSDGLYIRFREMIPEEGLLALARAEILSLHEAWPERVQCNIVIAPSNGQPGLGRCYDAVVELELGRRSLPIQGKGAHGDPYAALRHAFSTLRRHLPLAS